MNTILQQTPQSNTAVLVAIPGVPQLLTYSVGETSATIGSEVSVDLGQRRATGWVVAELSHDEALAQLPQRDSEAPSSQLSFSLDIQVSQQRLKPVLAAAPSFAPEQLALFEWMAGYYGCSLVDVLENAIPTRAKGSATEPYVQGRPEFLADKAKQQEILAKLQRRAPLQEKILREILEHGEALPTIKLQHLGPSWNTALRALVKLGHIEIIQRRAELESRLHGHQPSTDFSRPRPETIQGEQQNAVDHAIAALEKQCFSCTLLFGVTGSGKTEVYMQAIEHVLAAGGKALVIVPEIALTPQLLDQFHSRLQIPLAVLHSQVGETLRWNYWDALLQGEIRVAIGARSAIFAPMTGLSLIVVDEEHESSYKQSDGLRYQGRDVAVMRAKLANCPILLGSATPSFESLLNVKRGRYELVEMPNRATPRPVPQIEIIDLNKLKRSEMPSENLSPRLYHCLSDILAKKEQAVILYNKRGFASFLQCDTCEEVMHCPNCSVTLTYHQRRDKLLCHYCNLSLSPPSHCPYCRDPRTTRVEVDEEGNFVASKSAIDKIGKLVHRGAGTEKVVEELATLFPEARILRMDRDTVSSKDAYRQILSAMRNGTADILVGTQMIAKGHDLPGVTLVGIIDADVGLHMPDFRSSEKAFQLITQAAGRAGRGEQAGIVLLQTREPHHPTIVAASTGRFKAFARFELDYRKVLGYPPWGRLLRIVVSSPDRDEAFRGSQFLAEFLQSLVEQVSRQQEEGSAIKLSVLGPAPAPHERLRGRFRWHFLLKSNSARAISLLAHETARWRENRKDFRDLRISIDVDPVEML